MINIKRNFIFGKLPIILGVLLVFIIFSAPLVNADDLKQKVQDNASSELDVYKQELEKQGLDETEAEDVALDHIVNILNYMKGLQSSAETKYDELSNRVDTMHKDDTRRDKAKNALDDAKSAKNNFTGINVVSNFYVEIQIGGISPIVKPSDDFLSAEKNASDALSAVNRILIAPSRPGSVPEGDILEDFGPQLIRQLFRFAWLAVFISFVASGVMFVIAFDNEERITRAKNMIFFTLLGFAFVTLAFAIVKAVTDIDFFRFI